MPTRVLRPHAAGHVWGDPAQADNLETLKALLPFYRGAGEVRVQASSRMGLTQQIDKVLKG